MAVLLSPSTSLLVSSFRQYGPSSWPCSRRGNGVQVVLGVRRVIWRQVLNWIFYLLKTGCQWRMVPREFGKWPTAYAYFKAWREAGVWAKLREALRQRERRRQGRQAELSAES